jgi:hypothetical protein
MELNRLKGIPRDTSPDAFWVQCRVLRRLGSRNRSRQMLELIETVNKTAASGIRSRHPNYSDEEVRMALIRMRLGDHLFVKAFPGVDVRP